MSFRYAFQTLLRLRQSLERQEEQRLFAQAAIVARLRTELEEIRQTQLQARRQDLPDSGAVSHGYSLQYAVLRDTAFENTRKKLQSQLEDAERRRLQQLQQYQVVRQRREILEGLRDRQEAAYELEFSRREQQIVDEAFLLRMHTLDSE